MTLVTGGPMSETLSASPLRASPAIACIGFHWLRSTAVRCSKHTVFSLTRIDKATPGQVTSFAPVAAEPRVSRTSLSAGSFGLATCGLAATAVRKLAETKYPPHEAHQRTAALIGIVSQRSGAATVFIRSAAVQARK